MGPPQGPPVALSRSERVRLFGLDAVDALYFRGWAVGRTSRLRLTLQHVRTSDGKAIDITYSAPGSVLFGIAYPEPIRLRPGNTAAIEVTFTPSHARREESYMDFTTAEGSFRLPLLALEPLSALEVSRFELCALQGRNATAVQRRARQRALLLRCAARFASARA
jgi:hypothetical protein